MKYENIFLVIIDKLLPLIFISVSTCYFFILNWNFDFIVIFVYVSFLSYFFYKFYKLKYILFSKLKLGNKLFIFSNNKSFSFKSLFFWILVISGTYAKLLYNLDFAYFEIINEQIAYFSFYILVVIIILVILAESMIESSFGIYQKGIQLKQFKNWEEIIGYKIISSKIYIEIKNQNFGFKNNYLIPICDVKSIDAEQVKILIEKKLEILNWTKITAQN